MSLNSLKLLSIAKKAFDKNTIFRQMSFSRTFFNHDKNNDNEWFKNLSENSSEVQKGIHKPSFSKSYTELTDEEKKAVVMKFKKSLEISDDQLPLSFIEENWDIFNKRSSFNQVKNSLK